MVEKTRVACLGAGYFAQFHLEAWQRLPDADLVALCDQDPAQRADWPVPGYDDFAQMLAETKPDLVDIITPPPTHAGAIRDALIHKPKAIICQKPFCTSLEEARDVTSEAEAAGVPLIIHENFRFQPWYRVISDTMREGRIGTPHQVTFRLRTGDGQGPRAYLDRQPYFQTMPRLLIHETGVHWIDTFRFLMGEPTSVYADLRRLNPVIAGEDAGYFLMGFDGGGRALFDGNRLLDHAAESCRVTLGEAVLEGSEGTLSLSGDGSVHLRPFGTQDQTCLLAPRDWPGFGGDCVARLQAHVLAGLATGRFENEARDYLKVLEIEAAIYQSAQDGRKIAL